MIFVSGGEGMDSKAQKLFDAFHMFRKLKFHAVIKGMTHSEIAIMKALKYGDYHKGPHRDFQGEICQSPLSVSKLAKLVRVSTPSISRSLKGMEEKGYISRKIDTKDRRNSYVELTDFGETTLSQVETTLREFTDRVLDQMDPLHLEQLMVYLEELYQISEHEIQKEKESRKRKETNNE